MPNITILFFFWTYDTVVLSGPLWFGTVVWPVITNKLQASVACVIFGWGLNVSVTALFLSAMKTSNAPKSGSSIILGPKKGQHGADSQLTLDEQGAWVIIKP